MLINGIKTCIASFLVLLFGCVTALFVLMLPTYQQDSRRVQQPEPTLIIAEHTRQLSPEEQSTMSASFIREFESLIASQSGERK